MEKQIVIPGINIQWPISLSILSGEKIIETRNYDIPKKYIGKEMALIETPGPKREFEARIVAIIKFGKPFQYQNEKDFYKDTAKHLVTRISPWKWSDKKKWGWPILSLVKLPKAQCPPKTRGIRYALKCKVVTTESQRVTRSSSSTLQT